MLGRTISHYRITAQLGAGGMGVVYAGEDVRLGRPVALKFVPDDLADPRALQRLRAEARAASALNHPNICTIYDVGEHEGRPYLVMELLKGHTLRELLTQGPLKIHQAVDLGIQVADALDAAHGAGILHRDVKPANLFLMDRGIVKILDFGLAKHVPEEHADKASGTIVPSTTAPEPLTAEGVTVGTVSYMSPEQVTGEQLDGRTDLFSLGIVLYECVTGHRPFAGKTSAVILSAILNESPVAPVVFNPHIPARLQDVITNCLEKDRELRYQDAAGLRADLKRVRRDLESGPSAAAKVLSRTAADGRGTRRGSPCQRRSEESKRRGLKALVWGTAVAAASVAAGTCYWFWFNTPVPSEPPPAAAAVSLVDHFRPEPRGSGGQQPESASVPRGAQLRARRAAAVSERCRGTARSGRSSRRHRTVRRINRARTPAAGSGQPRRCVRRLAGSARHRPQCPGSGHSAGGDRRPIQGARASATRSAARSGAARPRRGSGTNRADAASARAIAPGRDGRRGAAAGSRRRPRSSRPRLRPIRPRRLRRPFLPRPARSMRRPHHRNPLNRRRRQPPLRRQPAANTKPPAVENDDVQITRVIEGWARAIEDKDLAAYRALKPNMTAAEQRRIEEGFRAVSSQRVTVTILGIEKRGAQAVVRLRRHDAIVVDGRQQAQDSQQTITVVRAGSNWVIRDIGR